MNLLKGTNGIVLSADGNAVVNGDGVVALPDGIGVVDLGTLTWAYVTSTPTPTPNFQASLSTIYNNGGYYTAGYVLCEKYINGVWGTILNTSGAYGYVLHGRQNVAITDSNYTDATAFKTAMSGVLLFYKKATT